MFNRSACALTAGLIGLFLLPYAAAQNSASAILSANTLPSSVIKALREANIPEEAIGVAVTRLADGATVISHGADKSFAPASTMKLVTTFIGLERLGPTYRGRTELRTDAPQVGSVLTGNLVLRGLADPDLDWEGFQRMLQTLRNMGIQHIQGDLIVDRQLFQPSRLDIGVPPFDEAPEFRYNVIPDALLINMNLLQLDLQSDANGMRIRVTPSLDQVEVVSNMTLIDGPCNKWEDGWAMPTQLPTPLGSAKAAIGSTVQIQLNGTFPRNCMVTTDINILDRAVYTDRLFRSLWAKLGGTYGGVTLEAPAPNPISGPAKGRLLAEHRSRPLAEVLRNINKQSDNTLARMLYLTLGAPPDAGVRNTPTIANAEQEVRAWFNRHGISQTGLVIENGSGLSRAERIRPSQLAGLLVAASHSNWAPEFMASLPIVGVDGTMRNRLRDTPAAAPARIKTGTLKDVVAIAGYVPDAMGKMCVVVGIVNHPRASGAVGRPIVDALINWVVQTDTRRDAATDWLIEQMKM